MAGHPLGPTHPPDLTPFFPSPVEVYVRKHLRRGETGDVIDAYAADPGPPQ